MALPSTAMCPGLQVSTPSPHVLHCCCTYGSCGLGDKGQGPQGGISAWFSCGMPVRSFDAHIRATATRQFPLDQEAAAMADFARFRMKGAASSVTITGIRHGQ